MALLHTNQPTRNMSLQGTMLYMAPEGMEGKLTAKVDCWSLGLTLLFCLTGQHPYSDLRHFPLPHLLLSVHEGKAQPVVPDTIVSDVRALLLASLQHDFHCRLGMQELYNGLQCV